MKRDGRADGGATGTKGEPFVGGAAPPFQIRVNGRAPLSLSTFAGQPMVLAFLADWSLDSVDQQDLHLARAELRGLGAILLIVSPASLWCFRPDEELELFSSGPHTVADIETFRRDYGGRGAGAPRLLVIDESGVVRLVDRGTVAPATFPTIVHGLKLAGRARLRHRDAAGGSPPASVGQSFQPSRREVVIGSLVAGLSVALAAPLADAAPVEDALRSAAGPDFFSAIKLRINGEAHDLRVDTRSSLLDLLRERLALTGTKKGCDHGQCGACTVLRDGHRVLSCLTLAVTADGSHVTTIEGLAKGDVLHPMQEAFVVEDGLQCGYCTPGQIMSAIGLLGEGHATSDADVREQMSGNICRCGAYPNIVTAIQRARHRPVAKPAGTKTVGVK